MIDISIIVASSRAKHLPHVLNAIKRQSVNGIEFETIIVQESNNFAEFNDITYLQYCKILRQELHFDYGASAKDSGILESSGAYLVFWDDDNLYFDHALISSYLTACNHDIGIVRVKHKNTINRLYIDGFFNEKIYCLCR